MWRLLWSLEAQEYSSWLGDKRGVRAGGDPNGSRRSIFIQNHAYDFSKRHSLRVRVLEDSAQWATELCNFFRESAGEEEALTWASGLSSVAQTHTSVLCGKRMGNPLTINCDYGNVAATFGSKPDVDCQNAAVTNHGFFGADKVTGTLCFLKYSHICKMLWVYFLVCTRFPWRLEDAKYFWPVVEGCGETLLSLWHLFCLSTIPLILLNKGQVKRSLKYTRLFSCFNTAASHHLHSFIAVFS